VTPVHLRGDQHPVKTRKELRFESAARASETPHGKAAERPLGLRAAVQQRRFDVVKIQDNASTAGPQLFDVRRTPEVLHYSQVVVTENRKIETAETIDQRRGASYISRGVA
jgi:hypothetical protein